MFRVGPSMYEYIQSSLTCLERSSKQSSHLSITPFASSTDGSGAMFSLNAQVKSLAAGRWKRVGKIFTFMTTGGF